VKPAFYIVDDDPSIRRILSNIIDEYRLGHVIAECSSGVKAVDEILKDKPDIVLVDLLLPNIDGIEIVKKVKKREKSIQFIMISQVNAKDMIEEAYKSGIEFFINKPINIIEVVSIIEKATESINLKNALMMIEKTLESNKSTFVKDEELVKLVKREGQEEIIKVLSDLGVLGEAGSKDLLNIVQMMLSQRIKMGVSIHDYRISDIYVKLNQKYKEEGKATKSTKAIEQRIRRLIQSALENLANIGIEDYTNTKFEKYSTSLFDFKEVRKEMDYIRNKSQYRGKINIKKFIEGIISHVEL